MQDRINAQEMLALCRENWATNLGHIDEFVVYLNRIRDLSYDEIDTVVRAKGLSSSEFDILATLRSYPPPHVLTPTQLRRSMLITSGGLTKLLHELERRGHVTRSVQEHDKRSKLVHLTDSGRALVEGAMEEVLKFTEQWITGVLSASEIKTLTRLMGKLNHSLEERLEETQKGTR